MRRKEWNSTQLNKNEKNKILKKGVNFIILHLSLCILAITNFSKFGDFLQISRI